MAVNHSVPNHIYLTLHPKMAVNAILLYLQRANGASASMWANLSLFTSSRPLIHPLGFCWRCPFVRRGTPLRLNRVLMHMCAQRVLTGGDGTIRCDVSVCPFIHILIRFGQIRTQLHDRRSCVRALTAQQFISANVPALSVFYHFAALLLLS